jgi:hypothetical protein
VSRRTSTGAFIVAGLLIALLLAFFVAPHASSNPDGLNKVAADKHLDIDVRAQAPTSGPFAGYTVDGIHDHGLSTGVAGIIGVTLTFGVAYGASKLTKTSRSRTRSLADDATA